MRKNLVFGFSGLIMLLFCAVAIAGAIKADNEGSPVWKGVGILLALLFAVAAGDFLYGSSTGRVAILRFLNDGSQPLRGDEVEAIELRNMRRGERTPLIPLIPMIPKNR